MNKRSINEYDVLKVFAILLVVLGHVTILFNQDTYSTHNVKIAQYITFGIYLFHMPLFMSISGAVYELSKFKYTNFTTFIINKLKRVIIPYFSIGIFVLLPVLIYLNPELSFKDPHTYYKIIFAQDCRHLWYLLALFWIYIFQYVTDKIRINLYVQLIISSIITLLISCYIPNFNFLCFHLAFRNWPCFILGMIMVRKSNKYPIIKSIIIAIIGAIVCASIIAISQNFYIDMIFSLLLPYFICFILIIVARQISFDNKRERFIQFFVNYGMGIYLFHVMIIYLLHHWLNNYIEMWNLMGIMFIASITFSISITWLIRRFRLQMLIGE